MAETLRSAYGPEVPRAIAAAVARVHPDFDTRAFLRECLAGYEDLNLMARGARMADALRAHLPRDYPEALRILLASIGPRRAQAVGNGMAPFFYLPHTAFVARHGLEHFEASMQAQHALTQRFTAEFSIRPFLERYPEATLARLREWASDPDEHVRCLVSEGTRPRLPWAPRLRAFQRDPAPVLGLLELLKDDPAIYVRRSVANHLNDIAKDHPDLACAVAKRWLVGADTNRRRLVTHALRTLVKAGHPQALAALGFGKGKAIAVCGGGVTPARATIGGKVTITAELANRGRNACDAVVDFRIHYVKASGRTSPKVFKLRTVRLAGGASVTLAKTVSLAEMTTRKHHPGRHAIDVLVNGRVTPLGSFLLRPSTGSGRTGR